MGLTAEQAAQWPHLDRDGDGVAAHADFCLIKTPLRCKGVFAGRIEHFNHCSWAWEKACFWFRTLMRGLPLTPHRIQRLRP